MKTSTSHTSQQNPLQVSVASRLPYLKHDSLRCCGVAALVAASLVSLHPTAQAATASWVGNTSADFSTSTNWSGSAISGNSWGFTAAGTSGTNLNNNLTTSAFNVSGITFNSGASNFTISGNTFTLTSDITNNAAATENLKMGIIFSANRSINNALASGTTILGGMISGNAGLTSTGYGTTVLNGTVSNTYTGTTTSAGGGTLILDFSNMGTATDLVKNGTTLALGSGTTGGGGTLIIKGKSSGLTSQTSGPLNVNNYATNLVLNSNGGGGTTLTLGSITIAGGNATLNIDLSSANTSIKTSTAAGTLGYATVKDASGIGFAQVSGSSVVRLSGQTTLAVDSNAAATDFITSGAFVKNTGAFSVNTLTLDATAGAGSLGLGGSTMTLTKGGLLATGSNAYTVANGQVGSTNSELVIHTMGTGGVTISALLGNGTNSFIKNGSDSLTLSAMNTYTGQTIINGGTLKAGSSQAFGVNSAVTLSSNVNAALDLNGNNVTIGSLNGDGLSSVLLGSSTLTISGGGATFNGNISGNGGSLVKSGTGNQTLGGANTFTGGVTVKSGTLTITNGAAAGTGTIYIGDTTGSADATFSMSVAQTILYNKIVAVAGNTGTLTLGVLAGSGNPTFSGTIELQKDLTFSQTTAGTLGFVHDNGTTYITGTGNFTLKATGGTGVYFDRYGNGTAVINMAGAFINQSTIANGVNVNSILGANVTGLYQQGTTKLELRAANIFSGNTTVSSGTLLLSNSLALQNSTLTSGGLGLVFNSSVASHAFKLGGLSGSADLALSDNAATPNAVALTIGNNNTDNTYSGALSGSGSLIKVGTGTQILSGVNTYTGVTTVIGGNLAVNGSLAAASAVTVQSGATLSGSGTVQGTVSGSSAIINGSGLNLGATTLYGASTLSGHNIASSVTVFSGSTTLTGTTQSTSALTVSVGATLNNNGTVAGDVNVNGGFMRGTGEVTGNLMLNSGTLAPGNSAGITTVDGDFTMDSASKLVAEVSGMVAGTSYDQLKVSGNVTLAGTLDLTTLNLAALDGLTRVVLIDNTGSGTTKGYFSSIITSGSTYTITSNSDYSFTVGSTQYLLSYASGAEPDSQFNDVTLTVVPEPTTWGLMVGGLGMMALLRRRS